MCASRSSEVQIHGFIVVAYTLTEKPFHESFETHWEKTKVINPLPMGIEAVYFCQDSRVLQWFLPLQSQLFLHSLR